MRYLINKILAHTSWSPKVSFYDGIELYIKWLLENSSWLFDKSNEKNRIGLKKK